MYLPQSFVCSHWWEIRKNACGGRREGPGEEIDKLLLPQAAFSRGKNRQPVSSGHCFHILLQYWKGHEVLKELSDRIRFHNSALPIHGIQRLYRGLPQLIKVILQKAHNIIHDGEILDAFPLKLGKRQGTSTLVTSIPHCTVGSTEKLGKKKK